MAARSPFPSIEQAFKRITVDGVERTGYGFFEIVDKLREKRATEWYKGVHATLLSLVLLRGGLARAQVAPLDHPSGSPFPAVTW